ncbi:RHS repeat-associated core domain-containing protein [Vibrio breoganii]|uniref:RHS repeat-associated core domain-containing protein n=1 Tax=Vibrio breoganii TaxID=553239 RepID=UPI001F52BC2F|nr:RHS repeat-associated core domain-containing protein [Vibrio breoganii]
MKKLFGLLVMFLLLSSVTRTVSALEVSLLSECQGALSCDGGREPTLPDNDENDDNDKDNEDPDSEPDPIKEDADAIQSEVSDISTQTVDAASSAGIEADQNAAETEAQTADSQDDNEQQQQQNSEQGLEGDDSDCPVELYSGCKITREQDYAHSLFPLTRKHRLNQGSAWSLGAGWHSALDSRILWGVDIDAYSLIEANQALVNQYQGIIDDIEASLATLETSFTDRIAFNEASVQQKLAEAISELVSLRNIYVQKRDSAQTALDILTRNDAQSEVYRQRNRYSADPHFPAEYEIGLNIIKWVTPQGARKLFSFDVDNSTITTHSGHSARLEINDEGEYIVTDTQGVRYQYNVHGFLVVVVGNDGRRVDIKRDSKQQTVSLSDELGRTLRFSYADGRLSEIVDQEGRITRYSYQRGMLTDVVQFDGEQHSYQYDYQANPLALTLKSDGEGNSAHYIYRQQSGKTVVDTQIDASGNAFSYEYDFSNRITTVINRNGTRTRYQYNANNQIVSKVFESDGSEVSNLYDNRGNLVAEYNELGEAYLYSYDDYGRLLSRTDPAGRRMEYVRDAQGRVLTQTNNAGDTTHFNYDVDGRLETKTLADGSTVKEEWLDNLLIKRVDQQGNHTLFEYDDFGYPIRIERFGVNTLPEQSFILHQKFDKIGRFLWVSEGSESTPEPLWRTTRYDYLSEDGRSLNSPTRIVDPLGREAINRYDRNGLITFHQDFSGVKTYFSYTSRQRVASKRVVMPSENGNIEYVSHYSYDAENNLVKEVLPHGAIWHYRYDARNRLISAYLEGTEIVRTFAYDLAGRRISETDSTNHSTHWSYYPDGKLQSISSPLGNIIEHFYDNSGHLEAIYDNGRGAYTVQYVRDELGHVVEVQDGNYNRVQYQVNSLGQVVSLSESNSGLIRVQNDLNWRGLPVKQSDAAGGVFDSQYNAFGEIVRISDSESGIEEFSYDLLGRKVSHLNKSGLVTQWRYEQQPNQLVVTQVEYDSHRAVMALGNSRVSTKTYDLLGRLLKYKDAAGQEWLFQYNQQGLIASVIEPSGDYVSREYNRAGNMISEVVTTREGESRETYYTYDGNGRVITEQLPYYRLGTVNTYRYNELGLMTELTLPDDSSHRFSYDLAGRRVAKSNPLGYQESWQYDANDNIVSYTDRDGFRWDYGYNGDNQLSYLVGPESSNGAATHYQYDVMGRLLTTIDPLGRRNSNTLDSLGRVVSRTDAAGNTAHIQLDSAGRPVLVRNRLGEETTQSFDAFDQLIATTDALGNTTQFQYDQVGRLSAEIDALGGSESWTYNHQNQVQTYTNQGSQTTSYQYDGFANLTQVEQANGAITKYQFNAANKPTRVISPNGGSQSFVYDELARLSSFSNELGEQWHYEYNLAGQVSHVYQPEYNTDIQFYYDKRGNMAERHFHHQGRWIEERLSYDAVGRLASISSPELAEQYYYDDADQLTQVDNLHIGKSFHYEYNSIGERTYSQLTDSEGVYFQHDAEGRVISIERQSAEGTRAFNLAYDQQGQVVQIDYPNHSRRTVAYDAVGRVTNINIEQEHFKGNRWNGSWNTVEVLEYHYDPMGNVIAQNRKSEIADNDQWAYFEYDQVNRLITADYPVQEDIEYEWDESGNLLHKKTKSHSYTYRYNLANQLIEMQGHRLPGFLCADASCESDDGTDVLNHDFEYEYDTNGHLVIVRNGAEQQVYSHDALGRLASVVNPDGSSVSYGYDARSRRVKSQRVYSAPQNGNSSKKAQQDISTLYSHYDDRQEQGQWFSEGNEYSPFRSLTLLPRDGLPYGEVLHQKLYDLDSPLLAASGTKGSDIAHLYVHHDRLGSAIHVLDETGTTAMRLGYSPFGQTYRKQNDKTFWKINAGVNAHKQLTQLMPYQYTGQYTESSTGLINLDARWYNPHANRFVQPDYWNLKNTYLPIEIQHELIRTTQLNTDMLLRDPSQQMAYGYVSGNPLKYIDLLGLYSYLTGGEWKSWEFNELEYKRGLKETLEVVSDTASNIEWVGIGTANPALTVGSSIVSDLSAIAAASLAEEAPIEKVISAMVDVSVAKKVEAVSTITKGIASLEQKGAKIVYEGVSKLTADSLGQEAARKLMENTKREGTPCD